ncbi:GGDEF/EAL domain-containing response regulator [Denitratisoma oestradiolicum]|uniref:Phytochrome-like protein cph2 n=1 Tax=Denitratisoma oestradiolicum TaxID=311182 RepID=A0A6S6XU51_9PROT|nr:GGDEF domain-containing response regulator [Denitratisoma oestradiolicum]TWO79785.1 hypothetical protein CBW56_12760 [Denitratisoma oestradiolicum]CAB1369475.1 Phytochrome-like protein cph2 [Denitratisoma oestradiolicum]
MTENKVLTILLIEDNWGDYRLVRDMLHDCAPEGFQLLHADQLAAAVPFLEGHGVDVILLDLGLPDAGGLDTLVKVHALAPEIPIVVLSQIEEEALAVRAVRIGAQDFLVKSHISGPLLTRSLRYALERRQLEEHLYRLAHHDVLTGLPNRKLFYERLGRALAQARRNQKPLALLLMDLNDFKGINDSFGHHVGDELLKQVSGRLSAALRATDCVARLGGDEFIVCAGDLADLQDAARVARKVLDFLEPPFVIEDHTFRVCASLGISLYPDDGEEMEALVRNADVAMYMAKGQGGVGNRFRCYSRQLDDATQERQELQEALQRAFGEGQFVVNYQPQVDLHSSRMIGVEALLRWHDAEGKVVMAPDRFIPAMEESGLILEVGEWVLKTACHQAAQWTRETGRSLKVAVNVSPRQFRDPRLTDRVRHALEAAGLPGKRLELEFTEEALQDDEELAQETLRELNRLGVRLALDNYRGRFLSLRDLKRFPIHSVKLDRTIVRDMTESAEDAAIVQAVISVAHVFKMKGIAEGVETRGQADLLRQQACDDAQGYMFARPLSAAAFSELLQREDDPRQLQ